MFSKPVWKWINAVAFTCMVLVNVLAETIPLAGNTTGRISALYPSPIAPAPFSFAIWGFIYLYLLVFVAAQLIMKQNSTATEALGPWFLISCIANIAWLFSWHYQAMTMAMIFIALLLVSLIVIEKRLRSMRATTYQRWMIRAPFGVYYGWITVATIANVSVWLSSIGFTGWVLPSQLWQVIVLLLGCAILCAGILINHDIPYGLAGLWAYAGIMIRQLSLDTTGTSYFWSLAAIIISCAVILLVIMFKAFACPVAKLPIFHRFAEVKPTSDFMDDKKDWRNDQ